MHAWEPAICFRFDHQHVPLLGQHKDSSSAAENPRKEKCQLLFTKAPQLPQRWRPPHTDGLFKAPFRRLVTPRKWS